MPSRIKTVDLGKFHSCTRQINEVDMGPCSPTLTKSTIMINDGKTENSDQFSKVRHGFEDPVQPVQEMPSISIERDSGFCCTEEDYDTKKDNHQKTDRKRRKRRASSISNSCNSDLDTDSTNPPFQNLNSNKYSRFDRSKRFMKSHYNHFISEDFQATPLAKYDQEQRKQRPSQKHKAKCGSQLDHEFRQKYRDRIIEKNIPFQFSSTPMKNSDFYRKEKSNCVHSDLGSEIQLSPIERYSKPGDKERLNLELIETPSKYKSLLEVKRLHAQKMKTSQSCNGADEHGLCKQVMYSKRHCETDTVDIKDISTPCNSTKHYFQTPNTSSCGKTKIHMSVLSNHSLQSSKSDSVLEKLHHDTSQCCSNTKHRTYSDYHPKSGRLMMSSSLSEIRRHFNQHSSSNSEEEIEKVLDHHDLEIKKPLCAEMGDDFVYKPNTSFYRQAMGRTPEILQRGSQEKCIEDQKSQIKQITGHSQNSWKREHPKPEGDISDYPQLSGTERQSSQPEHSWVTDTLQYAETTAQDERMSGHVLIRTQLDDILKEMNQLEVENTDTCIVETVGNSPLMKDGPSTLNEEADMFIESEREMLSKFDKAEIVDTYCSEHSPLSDPYYLQDGGKNRHRNQHTQTRNTHAEFHEASSSPYTAQTISVGIQCDIQPFQGRCSSLARLASEVYLQSVSKKELKQSLN